MQFKLKQNSKKANLDSAQYTLSFDAVSNTANYKILSSLIQENDFILEIDSSRFFGPSSQKEDYFKEILNYIRKNELDYTYHKTIDNSSQSIFAGLFNRKNTAHRAACYLPNQVWKSKSFRLIMPISGARYYILDKNNDKKILKYMEQMMEDEIINYFRLIIFDPGYQEIQQMGINSSKLSQSQIKELLIQTLS